MPLLLVVLIVIGSFFHKTIGSSSFSGLYQPSLRFRPDDAAGAFLIKKHRFVNTIIPKINTTSHNKRIHTGESSLNSVLRLGCQTCLNFQTRDYLDYFVESLATTMQQLEPTQHKAASYMTKLVKRTTEDLHRIGVREQDDDYRLNQTMAVLVYNGDATRRVSSRMKVVFFQAAFWSVRRYYHHVTVMTKGAQDHATVMDMHLPQATVVNLDLQLNSTLLGGLKASTATALVHGKLIASSLDWIAESWAGNAGWSPFRFLYFSIGDQLLHARRFQDLYDALDASLESNFLIAPHRMLTLPLAQSVSPELRDKLWPPSPRSAGTNTSSTVSNITSDKRAAVDEIYTPISSQSQPGAQVITERLATLEGSCCDAGRILFPDCLSHASSDPRSANTSTIDPVAKKNHTCSFSRQEWAGCAEWGARNFTQWLRVGPDGFAMPPVTVHLAHCSYSSVAELCPLPPLSPGSSIDVPCSRVPQPVKVQSGKFSGRTAYNYCAELPTVQYDPLTAHLLNHADAKKLHISSR